MKLDHSAEAADAAVRDAPFIAPEHADVPSARAFVLKSGDAFAVSDAFGDIHGAGDGFFVDDTRVLSHLRLTFGGRAPSLLSAGVSRDNATFAAHLTNRPLPPLGGVDTPEGVIHVERTRVLDDNTLRERIAVTNYGTADATVPLSISFAGDFRDMFEVRGARRVARGTLAMPDIDGDVVTLRYTGLDRVTREARVTFTPQPHLLRAERADFALRVAAGACVDVNFVVAARSTSVADDAATAAAPIAPPAADRQAFRDALLSAHRAMRARRAEAARLRSSNPLFNAWLDRSLADLALLTTDLPTGPYPYAGIPWFSTPFGRDAIVTAMQTLWLDPALARGVLRFLAGLQAHEESPFHDASPGKIMHETRKGEMAATAELPFRLYYGGVDTTPLFVALAGAYARRTGDAALIGELWPALQRAADWLERVCDANRFGLLDYQRGASTGLANQGWKDSHDSVFHADGRFPPGPIALVEVQAYAYRAFTAMSEIAAVRGADVAAHHYAQRADALRQTVERLFWMEDEQFYGIAVDGDGALCRVLASNAGHVLAFGLPDAARGAAVARRLTSSAFDSGWGVRTLALGQARFNPMSYHNGSVWPHDTAMAARGLARYGDRAGAVRLLEATFETAVHFDMRLPELFCGFARHRGEPPIAYPVACLPQAWAAGAPFMMLQACLGLTVDAMRREIRVRRPLLPDGIDTLEVRGVEAFGERVSLAFRKVAGKWSVDVTGGEAAVVVEL